MKMPAWVFSLTSITLGRYVRDVTTRNTIELKEGHVTSAGNVVVKYIPKPTH